MNVANSNVIEVANDRYSPPLSAGLAAAGNIAPAPSKAHCDLLAEVVAAMHQVQQTTNRLLSAMGAAPDSDLLNKCMVATSTLNAAYISLGAAKAVRS